MTGYLSSVFSTKNTKGQQATQSMEYSAHNVLVPSRCAPEWPVFIGIQVLNSYHNP